MQFRKTIVADSVAVAASSVTTFDLPVNPISFLTLTMRFLNVTDEATLSQVLLKLANIQVTRFGQAIFNMSGTDLQKLNMVLQRNNPILANQVATDNAARYISLRIPFSRLPLDPNEGIGATLRGELKCQITISASEADADNCAIQLEATEMLGASPKKYLKITTASITPVSGIDNDLALPIGNDYAGLFIFSTTVPTSTSFTTSAAKMKYLLDNVETDLISSNWESLHGDLLARVGHREEYDASADNDDIANYAFVDFSPNNEDTWLVSTKGHSQSTFRFTAGDANIVRCMPIELVANS